MQYTKMMDLINQARSEGSKQTDSNPYLIHRNFEYWIGHLCLKNLTEKEEDTLRDAFEEAAESKPNQIA
jgi:hypothetical protein